MREPLMTATDLAELCGVPLNTVYIWNHRGTGPRRVRVGRHVRYSRADVDAWLELHADPRPVQAVRRPA